jgi:TPR repeat protein
MKPYSRFRLFVCLLAAALLMVPAPAQADLVSAIDAHERGDYDTSLREFARLAKSGDAEATVRLADMYRRGQGVGRDDDVARDR